MEHIITALILFLPAGLANSSPVFASKIDLLKFLDIPVDMGLRIRGRRILGENKTLRGYLVGVFTGALTAFILFDLIGFDQLGVSGYSGSTLLFGGLLGFGALFGDSIKSFFKRQVDVKPGNTWIPFDQVDFIFGGSIVLIILCELDPLVYLWILLIYGLSHPISTIVGHKVGLRDRPI